VSLEGGSIESVSSHLRREESGRTEKLIEGEHEEEDSDQTPRDVLGKRRRYKLSVASWRKSVSGPYKMKAVKRMSQGVANNSNKGPLVRQANLVR